eukprot:Awhi_evm1s10467
MDEPWAILMITFHVIILLGSRTISEIIRAKSIEVPLSILVPIKVFNMILVEPCSRAGCDLPTSTGPSPSPTPTPPGPKPKCRSVSSQVSDKWCREVNCAPVYVNFCQFVDPRPTHKNARRGAKQGDENPY